MKARLVLIVMIVGLAAGAVSTTWAKEREYCPASPAGAEPPVQMVVADVDPDAVAEVRARLAESGVKILALIEPHRWLVAGISSDIRAVAGVRTVSDWKPSMGLTPDLRRMAAVKGVADERQSVVVALVPGFDLDRVGNRFTDAGAEIAWVDPSAEPVAQLGLRIPGRWLADLVDVLDTTPGLVWAEAQAPVRLLNYSSVWRCQSGARGSTPVHDRGIRGEGRIIGIMDTGIDVDDCRFDDPAGGLPALNQALGTEINPDHRKVLAVDFHWSRDWPVHEGGWDDHGHGTHVAGSAAGDELADGLHSGVDGMAPAARLVIQDGGALTDDCADLPGLGCPVKPLGPMLEQAWEQGARIHTNSWGDEENFLPFGRYTERTADVDRFMWEHKEMLVLFAAGNSGPGDGTVISPSTGKNVISVGATEHGDTEAPCVVGFSSRGWTQDGRIKPDVVAPGWMVVSAGNNFYVPDPSCFDAVKSGTSMAAPTAAGLAALVRQYFADGFHPTGHARPSDGFSPSAALVKAVLIASAVDLNTMGCAHESPPSRDQGWGLIQLDTALAFDGGAHRLVVDDHREGFTFSGDEPVRLDVTVMGAGPLEVVLVWTDAPSTALAATNLVNDLDLSIAGPSGVFPGNSFSNGVSVPGGEPDRLNNVEVVRLPVAEKGVWTIEVAPHAIASPAQDWALVVTGPVSRVVGPRHPSGRIQP